MFFKRTGLETVDDLLASYSVVTIVGPRQSGKTTLAKLARPEMAYVNLEDLNSRDFAQSDPVKFIEKYQNGAIIDEIQRVPELSSQIQVLVDSKRQKGLFLLTGSHQFEVMEKVSQSLAGRTAVFRLLPLSMRELTEEISSDELIFNGFYPQVHAEKLKPTFFYQDYVSTYLERDLRQLQEVRNLETFRRFLKLAAGRIGQILDLSDLGNAVGVSQPTARAWLTLLQASYVVYLLPPYFTNFGKRVSKRPKLYFYDTGLASFLLDMTDITHVETHPLRGALFENIVVIEALKRRFNAHLPSNAYFYRDKSKQEIDLLLTQGEKIQAIEIKSGKTVSSDFLKNLRRFEELGIPQSDTSILVYDGDQTQERNGIDVLPLWRFAEKDFKG